MSPPVLFSRSVKSPSSPLKMKYNEIDNKPASRWPLWKKLALAGILLIVAISLGVGLGVGLSRGKSGDDGDNNEGNDSGNGTDTSLNRTSLWQPEVGATWQIILLKPMQISSQDKITPDVEIFDLDLYDNDISTFTTLKKLGKKLICYFSAGSWEDWRDDKGDFDTADLGKELDGWPNERWLNVSSPSVRNIMKKRIAVAAQKGCDAIDPDNVDGFQNENGLGLTKDDTIDFVKFLSATAASFNMSTGLKNAGSVISDVISDVHFSVNEQCVEFSECETFAEFISHQKPVFHIEYPKGAPGDIAAGKVAEICSAKGNAEGTKGFSTVIKKMNLDPWVEYCNGNIYGA